jgi:thiosulfate/3-mercaptopyruvate sulfurtransferase
MRLNFKKCYAVKKKKHLVLLSTIVALLISYTFISDSEIEHDDATSAHASQFFSQEAQWIVSSKTAHKMMTDGAIVIDARSVYQKRLKPTPAGAIPLQWQDLSMSAMSEKGLPLPPKQGARKLSQLGITNSKPIIVIGDWQNGWGEDGRIAWTLRTWGYSHAVLIDGGLTAIEKIGIPIIHQLSSTNTFTPTGTSPLQIGIGEVKRKIDESNVSFIDVRESREFFGQTPYGETRGGHLPNAKNIWFKDFVNSSGSLKSKESIDQLLLEKGISPNNEIIIYCSGGFRSAWVTAVLRDLGYQARNYAGSMWQWSNKNFLQYPLVMNQLTR